MKLTKYNSSFAKGISWFIHEGNVNPTQVFISYLWLVFSILQSVNFAKDHDGFRFFSILTLLWVVLSIIQFRFS